MHVQDKTVEIAVRLSPKQLDHVAPVLEEIIHEIVAERQRGLLKKSQHVPCIFFYYQTD